MKTQKLTLAAVFATTLLSTSAFADFEYHEGDTSPNIDLSLTIAEKCMIHGLGTTNTFTIDQTTKTLTISDFYASCNGQAPNISFNSANVSGTTFRLVKDSAAIGYTIKIGSTAVTPDTSLTMPTATGTNLVFTAAPTDTANAGKYQDTLTTTITL